MAHNANGKPASIAHKGNNMNRVKRQALDDPNKTQKQATPGDNFEELKGSLGNIRKVIKILAGKVTPFTLNLFHFATAVLQSFDIATRYLNFLDITNEDFEARLSSMEVTAAEVVKKMAMTKSYLESLRTNMSNVVDVTRNETVEGDGHTKELSPSKDMEALNNYLKNIEKMKKEDLQKLGHQKQDFIATCSWQGGVCDSGFVSENLNTTPFAVHY